MCVKFSNTNHWIPEISLFMGDLVIVLNFIKHPTYRLNMANTILVMNMVLKKRIHDTA